MLNKIGSIFRNNKGGKNNSTRFIPRQTFSVNIDGLEYYISLICDDNFQVKVVLLNSNNSIVDTILELDTENASIVKLQGKLYTITDRSVYIHDIKNLKANPNVKFLGNLNLQCACANSNFIYAYSIEKDKIIKYDENMAPIQEYENKYSKDNCKVPVELTCNETTFFSIPIMELKEEQYISRKRFIAHYFGSDIAESNISIHSCGFNNDDNTLYISMSNIIWVIKDGTEFSYLHLKHRTITNVFYDNDIKKLILNFGGTEGNHVRGSIQKLSNKEIQESSIKLTDITTPFYFSKNIDETSSIQTGNGEIIGSGTLKEQPKARAIDKTERIIIPRNPKRKFNQSKGVEDEKDV